MPETITSMLTDSGLERLDKVCQFFRFGQSVERMRIKGVYETITLYRFEVKTEYLDFLHGLRSNCIQTLIEMAETAINNISKRYQIQTND